jgi:hypothetical protein
MLSAPFDVTKILPPKFLRLIQPQATVEGHSLVELAMEFHVHSSIVLFLNGS